MKKSLPFFPLLLTLASTALAQNPDSVAMRTYAFTVEEDLLTLQVKELDLPDVSALSLEPRKQLDLPYATYVVSAEEIDHLGLRSVPEALRLVPGIVVREITRDNFVVYFHGSNQLPSSDNLYQINSPTILVMINGLAWNHGFNGEVDWNSIPVPMEDIDRIEVIRQPMGVTQGIYAVEGMVNIVSQKAARNNVHLKLHTENSLLTQNRQSFALEAGLRSRLNLRVSGQRMVSQRTSNQYYHLDQADWYAPDSLLEVAPTAFETAQYPELARQGTTLFSQLTYTGRKKDRSLTTGFFFTSMTTQTFGRELGVLQYTQTGMAQFGVYFNGNLGPWYAKFQTGGGVAQFGVGYQGISLVQSPIILETGFDKNWDRLQLKAGTLSYGNEALNFYAEDEQGRIDSTRQPFGGVTTAGLRSMDAFAQARYSLLENKLWLGGGIRMPISGVANALREPSLEANATYEIFSQITLRGSWSKASGHQTLWSAFYNNQEQVTIGQYRQFVPNPDLAPVKSQGLEFGIRGEVFENVYLDAEAFRYRIHQLPQINLTELNLGLTEATWSHAEGTMVKQGATFSVQTFVENFTMGYHGTLLLNRAPGSAYQLRPISLVGSANVVYTSNLERFTIGAYSSLLGPSDAITYDGEMVALPGRLIYNLQVQAQLFPSLGLFFNGKNLFNETKQEFYYGDPGSRLISIGLNADF